MSDTTVASRPEVLRDCESLIADYGGSLRRLHDVASNAHDLEEKLLAFYGVGPVTANIFLLRELFAALLGQGGIPIRCLRSRDWRNDFAWISHATRQRVCRFCQGRSRPYSTAARARSSVGVHDCSLASTLDLICINRRICTVAYSTLHWQRRPCSASNVTSNRSWWVDNSSPTSEISIRTRSCFRRASIQPRG